IIFSCNESELIEERLEDNPIPEEEAIVSGDADFTKYVALGNSLTAGFMDGALFPLGQRDAYPSILAAQFEQTGGGSFAFPDIVSGNGFGALNEDGSIRGRSSANAAAAADPTASLSDIIQFSTGSPITTSTIPSASINNFAVPGMRMVDAGFAGYGALNPYFGGFQSSATASVIGDAAAAGATFFSVWLGSNDVLGYALSGGAFGEDFDPTNPSTLSSVDAFNTTLSAVLDAMSANGADGVILNIPPVTLAPFFQFVTSTEDGINLIPLDAATASVVNDGYVQYNDGLDAAVALSVISAEEAARRKISFA
ncbi:MAG: G-D-S-L family lipolytic protein, partial [Bacteroidota bacterium]